MIKSKIYIHPLYYLVAFISFFTGYFKYFSIYSLVILIHELGHIFAGLVLKWPIRKISVYPFGCMTMFEKENSSLLEEFLIVLYGPLFQILFNMIYPTKYHIFILFFNLLPIYPLDGSKILFLTLNCFSSYYYSYIYVYIISLLILIVLLVNNINFISWIILLYLLFDLYRYYKQLNITMINFFYERYKYKIRYKKNNIIVGNNKYKMFKCRNNYFYINKKYYYELDILRKMFDK